MPGPRERDLLVRAARLYFEEGKSQNEVAMELATSRSNVSRMLAAAREQGIVEIRINDPAGRDIRLETSLKQTFDLAEAVVAGVGRYERAVDRVGDMGARWLTEQLRDGITIALSWGATIQKLVWSVHVDHPYQVEITQIVGGLSPVSTGVTGQEVVRELADRLGATYRYLHAPAVLTSKSTRDALMEETSVRDALDAACKAEIALVGVGDGTSGSSGQILAALQLTDKQLQQFQSRGPAGDIAARFYDMNGVEIAGPVQERVLAVSLDEVRRIPLAMGVAAGRDKARAILAAFRGRLLDGIITDVQTARAVLALHQELEAKSA